MQEPGLACSECSDWSPSLPSTGSPLPEQPRPLCTLQHCSTGPAVSISDQPGDGTGDNHKRDGRHLIRRRHSPSAPGAALICPAHAETCSTSTAARRTSDPDLTLAVSSGLRRSNAVRLINALNMTDTICCEPSHRPAPPLAHCWPTLLLDFSDIFSVAMRFVCPECRARCWERI